MAKRSKIRFSGYYPAEIIRAIKNLAEKEDLSDNEAATELLETGIAALNHQAPAGLKGIDLAVCKAEQKEKQK